MANDVRFRSFYFINPVDGRERRATVVFRQEKRNDELRQETVAFAICNPRDNFDRKEGQRIALDYLNEGNSLLIATTESFRQVTNIKGHKTTYANFNGGAQFVPFIKELASEYMAQNWEKVVQQTVQ